MKTNLNAIINDNFLNAYRKLTDDASLPVSFKFKMMKLGDEIEKNITQFNKLRDEILKQYTTKDADGKDIYDNDEINKQLLELLNTDITLDINNIKLPSQAVEKLSIIDIQALKSIFDISDLEKEFADEN